MLRKYLGLAVVAGALLVSACNTVAGAGDDLKSVSSTAEDAINK